MSPSRLNVAPLVLGLSLLHSCALWYVGKWNGKVGEREAGSTLPRNVIL